MPNARFNDFAAAGLALAAPSLCGGCGDALPTLPSIAGSLPTGWCTHCFDRWGPTPGAWQGAPDACPGWAAAEYRGRVRRALLQAKRGAPEAAIGLLLHRLQLQPGSLPSGAHITWVPGHPRRALRGPDAGQALARAVARQEGRTVERLLWRVPWARRQAGRTVDERCANPHRLGLRAVGRAPSCVVLVDDVRTTGTTLDHAARLLRSAGADHVVACTVAIAPPR
ncbi:MAG: ComF family protein [Solirubrobacteraceae bacterium]|nr:ComF family protein [Solirubrobacteraceae bacterium]